LAAFHNDFKARHGGRHAAGTGGHADERRQIRADGGLGVLFQFDGRAVFVRAVGGIFQELHQGIVGFGNLHDVFVFLGIIL
jgi:hypothetical protein